MNKSNNYLKKLKSNFLRHKGLYFMLIPIIAFYLLFCYYPMYGAQIAFRDYTPKGGIWGSEWVGLKHFKKFFDSIYFKRVVGNTLSINIKALIFGFPMPIILALMMNEVRSAKFKSMVETISYLPHFISTVVIVGMIQQFVGTDGFIYEIAQFFGYKGGNMLMEKDLFQPIYVISDIWQGVGWSSIIYIAAISGINEELYEAARIDGAGRWRQMIHITLPGIATTVMTMLILRIGGMLNLGYEKILLMYSPVIYETSDVISTYVYRKGLLELSYSFSSAVGLLNSVVSTVLVLIANKISNKLVGAGIW